ncbi:MAG: DUF1801 domain-containing protein [Planctomycetota bacterium]
MSDLKTKQNKKSVTRFLSEIEDPEQRQDTKVIAKLMREVTGARASMWGDSIVGYGKYRFRYASGREGDWFLTGFSPRKGSLSLYIMDGVEGHAKTLRRLGKHKNGKACLYVKRLSDIDIDVLRELIEDSVAQKRTRDIS